MFQVILDGQDITQRCADSIQVSHAEQASKIASFVYAPVGTPTLPTELVRKPVTISEEGVVMFTGWVSTSVWEPGARKYKISCSDLLQETFETMTEAQILAAIPGGVYSVQVFGDREDGWRQAQDVMSTVPSDVHLSATNVLTVVPWTAKGTPDRSYTGNDVLNDGAYQLDLASARDIITQRKITYALRMSRWKLREHRFSFNFFSVEGPTDFCDYLANHNCAVPTADMILSASGGTGWEIKQRLGFQSNSNEEFEGIRLKTFPPSGFYDCGLPNGVVWINPEETRKTLITYAAWTGLRYWAQTLTETYEITLNCEAAQGVYGVVTEEDSVAHQPEVDDSGYENGPPPAAFSWPIDSLGDFFEDQFDEAERASDIQTVMAVGHVAIWRSLRKNYVVFDVLLDPTLSLEETIRVTTADIDARGKVARLQHRIDQRGQITTITLAITRGGEGIGDTLMTPARPISEPTHPAPASATSEGTRIGGCGDSVEYDEEWMGFTANHQQTVIALHENPENDPDHPNYDPENDDKPPIEVEHTRPTCAVPLVEPTEEQLYPIKFQIKGPDIEDEARDDVDVTQTAAYRVSVPEDLLVLF